MAPEMNLTSLRSFLKRFPPELKYVLLLFFATRAALLLIGVISFTLLEPIHGQEYVWRESDNLLIDMWGVWDSPWYIGIAKDGYHAEPLFIDVDGRRRADYAFFPLYPLLMAALGGLLGDVLIAGIIISNIALIIAAFYLYRLVQTLSDAATAQRSVKYLFLFPLAFIFSAVLTESLFLALIVISFYYATQKNWLFVGIFGFFAALTRPFGALIFLPLLFEYFRTNYKSKTIGLNMLYLVLIPLGFLLFLGFVYYLTGDPLAYSNNQEVGWGQRLSNPAEVMFRALTSPDKVWGFTLHFGGLFTLAFLILLTVFYKKIGVSYWFLGMLLIIVPLSGGLASVASLPRYILSVFPIYIIFGKLASDRNWDHALTPFLVLLQGFLMVFWSHGFPLVI